MATARDIIEGALSLINVVGDGLSPSPEMISRGHDALNDILVTWNNQELMLYKTRLIQGTLSAGVNPTSIGPMGDIDTTTIERPARIERLYTRVDVGPNPVDFIAQQIDHNRYQEIITKNVETSYPTNFYYQADYPLGYIYTYPVQSQDLTVVISAWDNINTIVNVVDDLIMPYGYDVALKYQLAVDLAPSYGKSLNRGDAIYDRAAELRRQLKAVNQRDMNVTLDNALMSHMNNSNRFNILRGF